MGVGEARRVLVIGPDASPALRLREELASVAGRRVWLWHERSLTHALTVLSVAECDMVLLDPDAGNEPWAEMAWKVQRLAPDAIVMPYAEDASARSVPRANPAAAARILLQLLGLEVRRGPTD